MATLWLYTPMNTRGMGDSIIKQGFIIFVVYLQWKDEMTNKFQQMCANYAFCEYVCYYGLWNILVRRLKYITDAKPR